MASNKSKRQKTSDRAPQNISKIKGQWGGPRPNSGGARPGAGKPQRQPSPWPEDCDLKTAKGIDRFLSQLIETTWKSNVLDPRTVGCLNNTVKLLLELRGWTELDDDLDILPARDPVDYESKKSYRDSLYKEEDEA